MIVCILGRQPAIGMAELERLYGGVHWFSDQSAIVDTGVFDIERVGGTLKAGHVVADIPRGDWRQASTKIIQEYSRKWAGFDGKITVGISTYGFDVSSREIQKTGLVLKSKLKTNGASIRLIPNTEPALNTAASHHNKLGLSDNKVELLVVRARNGKIVIAESVGAQNITALARRDQERPKRDAFVGMLPPKLAQIMINLAGAAKGSPWIVLDPFCGTGVVLQEALLLGYDTSGTDLSDKMIDFSTRNLDWIKSLSHAPGSYRLEQADAMTARWSNPIDAVVSESYLGQPFSAPPSPSKLVEVRGNCDHIISTFLTNIAGQLKPGTPLCVAVPAWRSTDGSFTHLPLIRKLSQLGYEQVMFDNVRSEELLYARDNQVVARELLVLIKSRE